MVPPATRGGADLKEEKIVRVMVLVVLNSMEMVDEGGGFVNGGCR